MHTRLQPGDLDGPLNDLGHLDAICAVRRLRLEVLAQRESLADRATPTVVLLARYARTVTSTKLIQLATGLVAAASRLDPNPVTPAPLYPVRRAT